MKSMQTIRITKMAVCLALVITIELLEGIFLELPQGGSISLSSLLFFVSLADFSLKEGTLFFVLWRIVMMLIKPPFIVTPMQALLDYFVAYGPFLLGCFAMKFKRIVPAFLWGITLANVLRYSIHVVTGIFYFGLYAKGPVVSYALMYNLTYMLPTLVLQWIIGIPLVSILLRRQFKNKG